MSHPDRSELFVGWNLEASEEGPPPRPSDMTRSWPAPPPRAGEGPRDVEAPGPAAPGPIADFTLHPHDTPAGPVETVGRAGAAKGGPVDFPRIGAGIGGFRLVSELGRGAFGRVYLAEEAGLGNRPVALKVSRPEGDEPRLLALLQHTHIVPIHSVQDDPETGLRLMCMPYFGGANLAQVLDAAGDRPMAEGTGLSLIDALDLVGQPPPSDADRPASIPRRRRDPLALSAPGASRARPDVAAISGPSMPLRSILGRISWWSRSLSEAPGPADDRDPVQPARRFLREASFVRAAAWIGARLAEGLEHAHSRGLLHRDLKPSNILIAADGTPMLLDFNLAADAPGPHDGDRALLGGTLPYMAPEHLDAFNPRGSTPPEAVDERSDVYALGLILSEMIVGRHPFPEPAPGRPLLEVVRAMTLDRLRPAPSPRAVNPAVPWGLDAIVRKCIDPNPDRRHQRAGDLAEDLRRYLDDQPLKYTREPSLRERAAKWARRNPRATGATTVGLLAMGLIVLIAGAGWTVSQHLRQASARLRLRGFEARFQECQFLLNIAGGPADHLGRGVDLADEVVRQAGVDDPAERPRDSWLTALAPDKRASIRGDLAELLMLSARARVAQAERSKSEPRRQRALEAAIARLDLAERLDPAPTHALFADRSRYHAALGRADLARVDRARRDATPPATSRDFYLIGTADLAQGRPDRAEPALIKAVGLDPRRFWSWFALGLCHYDQGRFAEAAGDFAVCTVLAPRFSWPWLNRGLALAKAGRLVEARGAYDRAVEADPRSPEARVNRGLTCLELGDAPAAVADLERAVALGRREAPVRATLAEAIARSGRPDDALRMLDELVAAEPASPLLRIARGTIRAKLDPRGAEDDFRRVLADSPGHPGAHLGLARLLHHSDPRAALTAADRAVQGDPDRLDARELRALIRGKLGDPLAVADVDRLIRAPTPHRLFNAACALALLGESRPDPILAARVLDLLRRALESGFPAARIGEDPDLKSLRPLPAFRELLGLDPPRDGSP